MSVSPEDMKKGRINDELGTKLDAISAQVEANVERGKDALAEFRVNASDKATQLGRQLDQFTHEKPWHMTAYAFIGGMVLGLICGCRKSGRR